MVDGHIDIISIYVEIDSSYIYVKYVLPAGPYAKGKGFYQILWIIMYSQIYVGYTQ